jgi:hypothetical protein
MIAVEMLEPVLTNLLEKLWRDNLKLCYVNARDVYKSRNVDVARSEYNLFIRLRIPYSELPWLNVYETSTVGIPVPGKEGWLTTIKNIPPLILMEPTLGLIGEILIVPSTPVIDELAIRWHQPQGLSCLLSWLTTQHW